jgi:hypothetical protein
MPDHTAPPSKSDSIKDIPGVLNRPKCYLCNENPGDFGRQAVFDKKHNKTEICFCKECFNRVMYGPTKDRRVYYLPDGK